MALSVFFDLDGTLTDSAPGICNSIAYALKKTGHAPLTQEELHLFVGPPLIDAFMEKCGYDKETALLAVSYFREYFTEKGIWENAPYPGVKEMLEDLSKNGAILRIATTKPQPMAKEVLDHFDLLPYFARVDGASLDESKPSDKTSILTRALREMPPPGPAVMVGDRRYDMEGGKNCGLATVGVLYGYGSREEMTQAAPDALAETVADCGRILFSLL